MAENLTRRDFLSYSGATLVGVTLGEWGRRRLARADARAETWRGREAERFVASVCRECPAGCGLRVRLVDDVPVKVDGNPNCPVARGKLCPKGQASIESYYDPDRLVGPARRIGKRGQQQWERISWAAATTLLASQIARAAGDDGMLAVASEQHGPLADAWTEFWKSAGARVAWSPAQTAAHFSSHLEALTGASADPAFDLAHATYVLSFGAPVVEDWLSPVWAQRAFGEFRRGRTHSRGRLVQVDYRRSLTAKKADEWLAVAPEAQVFLAYGIMSVLLREDRVNRTFLDEFGGNLADFDREIIAGFTPDQVSAVTGVPVVSILRLARDLTATPQPLAVVAADADPHLIDAVFALNALLGAFDRPGGISANTIAAVNTLEDAGAIWREVAAGRLHPHLVALADSAVLRARTAPFASSGLDDSTFVVSFSPHLDEAAAIADLLMPAHTPMEAWHALAIPTSTTGQSIALAQPAVHPLLNTRDLLTSLKAVGDAVGGRLASSCTWHSSEDLVKAEVDRLKRLGRGGPFSSAYQTDWLSQLEEGGWWVSAAGSSGEFADVVLGSGGWSDPFFQPGQIRGALARRGGLSFVPPLAMSGRMPAGETAPQPPNSPSRQFPLQLVSFTPAVVGLIGAANQPAVFELLGQPESAPWQVWAELGSETATQDGIKHGSRVRITSASGSIEAIAMVTAGMPAGIIALSFVPKIANGGRWARQMDADVRLLWGSSEATKPCRVHVSSA